MTTLKTVSVKAIFQISLNIGRIYESSAFYTIVNFNKHFVVSIIILKYLTS